MIETEGVVTGYLQTDNVIEGNINVGKQTIELQEKSVTPTTQTQEIVADENYDGLEKVNVGAIPSEYIVPTGTLEITSNNTYNVREYESANVNVPQSAPNLQNKTATPSTVAQTITADEGYDGLDIVTVDKIPDEYVVPSGSIDITTNGEEINVSNYQTAKAAIVNKIYYSPQFSDSSAPTGYYSNINLNTTVFLGNTAYRMFYQLARVTKITFIPASLSTQNFANATNISYMFVNCGQLTTIENLGAGNFSKVTNASQMFSNAGTFDDATLNDILLMCTKITSSNFSSSNKKLSYLGLWNSSINKIKEGSASVFTNRQAFLDAGWQLK